ncbi:MAG: hypothetical protein INR70_28305 [Parafilimonas terrae]|jgi:GntR family transcriptional regulator / MocR family aminotransferase|nr:hypothetical protein [Parafilimonas terrae]
MERVYRDKGLAAQRAILEAYGGPLSLPGTQGGFNFFLRLTEAVDEDRFLDPCRSEGLRLQAASLERPGGQERGIVIGSSSLTLETIASAGTRLGHLLRAG